MAWCLWGNPQQLLITKLQWGVLIWLGVVASGLGYFMWNYGATQVDAGTLGIMNNMHVPAGLLVNLAIWQQQPHWVSFIIGAAVIAASLWVHHPVRQRRNPHPRRYHLNQQQRVIHAFQRRADTRRM